MKIQDIINRIDQIGRELVNCQNCCKDIVNDPHKGVIPRCLYLEYEKRRGRGSIVVGLNPGRSDEKERNYYKEKGTTYNAVKDFFQKERAEKHLYYIRIRGFIDLIGLSGPILWSELVKCEKRQRRIELPLDTLRTCTGKFLKKELEVMPDDWPIIGVGREAYKACSYLFPDRTVIGIPHPTGSHGQFSSILTKNKTLRKNVAKHAIEVLDNVVPTTIWISQAKK